MNPSPPPHQKKKLIFFAFVLLDLYQSYHDLLNLTPKCSLVPLKQKKGGGLNVE